MTPVERFTVTEVIDIEYVSVAPLAPGAATWAEEPAA